MMRAIHLKVIAGEEVCKQPFKFNMTKTKNLRYNNDHNKVKEATCVDSDRSIFLLHKIHDAVKQFYISYLEYS